MSIENTVDSRKQTIEVQNVVATSELGQEVDLEPVSADLDGAEFTPEEFHGLKYQPDAVDATSLVFRSGKLTCTGANTIEKAHEAIQCTLDAFEGLGIQVIDSEVTVENIVSSADLGEELNLNAIAIGFGLEDIEYEPEQFPGLIYRMDDPDVVVLLFGSGKCIITGAKTHDAAEEGLETVLRELEDLALLG